MLEAVSVKKIFQTKTKKKVLFIGSGGVLGSAFVDTCGKQRDIIGVTRSESSQDNLYRHIKADIAHDSGKIFSELQNEPEIDAVIFNAVKFDLVPLLEKTPENFMEELRVAMVGPLELANLLMQRRWVHEPAEVNRKWRRSFIFITSGSGLHAYTGQGQGTYAAIKAAVHMLVKHMAAEFAEYGVRVNVVAPGWLGDSSVLAHAVSDIDTCLDEAETGQLRAIHPAGMSLVE